MANSTLLNFFKNAGCYSTLTIQTLIICNSQV